ncbi:MAG: outer membrane beta-barrel protein [Saprospiraceae bacterium]|nr:outer membrane beta-barrel protein [Saprospiraceae bacterium]
MKNCLLNLSLIFVLFTSTVSYLRSQSRISIYAQGGVLIGSPFGEIPEGATGKPGVRASTGAELKWTITHKLSAHIGALFAHKSNEFQTPVTGKYNISDGVLGIKLPFPINVNYRGTVYGAISNKYVDIPVYAGFQVGRRTMLALGYQYSHLLDGRFDGTADVRALALNFPGQEFDESHLLRKDDHAVIAGMHYQLFAPMEIRLRFGYGLNNIFTEIPDGMSSLRNLYLGLMVAYGFSL